MTQLHHPNPQTLEQAVIAWADASANLAAALRELNYALTPPQLSLVGDLPPTRRDRARASLFCKAATAFAAAYVVYMPFRFAICAIIARR